jgi:hypothetical protein
MPQRDWTEIRIRGVSKKVVEELLNISKNSGVPLSDLLKPKLREIADSFPDSMKRTPATS